MSYYDDDISAVSAISPVSGVKPVKAVKTVKSFTADKTDGEVNYMDMLKAKMEEMEEKIRNGETEESIPTGGQSFTVKEWNKLISTFDKAQDKIKEAIEEESEKQKEKRIAESKAMKENAEASDDL